MAHNTLITSAIVHLHAHEENQEHSWFEEYLYLLQDPAHVMFEITISVIFDFLIIFMGYKLFLKKIVLPKLRREIHKELDDEHHVIHHDHVPGDEGEACNPSLSQHFSQTSVAETAVASNNNNSTNRE